jgi:hypothetical protein
MSNGNAICYLNKKIGLENEEEHQLAPIFHVVG